MSAPEKSLFPRTIEALVLYVVWGPKTTLNINLQIGTEAQELMTNPHFRNFTHRLSSLGLIKDVLYCSGLEGDKQVYTEATVTQSSPHLSSFSILFPEAPS